MNMTLEQRREANNSDDEFPFFFILRSIIYVLVYIAIISVSVFIKSVLESNDIQK